MITLIPMTLMMMVAGMQSNYGDAAFNLHNMRQHSFSLSSSSTSSQFHNTMTILFIGQAGSGILAPALFHTYIHMKFY